MTAAIAAVIGLFEIGMTVLEMPFIRGAVWYDRTDLFLTFGFDPVIFRFGLQMSFVFRDAAGMFSGAPVTLLTYPWVHPGFVPACFSSMLVLCIGSLLSRLVGQWASASAFFLSSLAGGLAFAALPELDGFLIGAVPGGLGMTGLLAGLFLIEHGKGNPAVNPAMVAFPYLFIGIKIVQDMLFAPSGYWCAHTAGFAAGLLMSLAAHGSLSYMRAGLRRLFSS